MTETDQVVIEGLRCKACVGVTAAERRKPQRLVLDITFRLPLARAGTYDHLEATVDYAAAAKTAQQVAAAKPYRLVEAVAESIVAALLKQFPVVPTIELRVRKFSVSAADAVGVCITRHHTG